MFTLDMDGHFGPYMRCNPFPFANGRDHYHVDTRKWSCYPWHGYAPAPWNSSNSHRSSCNDGAYCGARMNHSVGRDPAMHHQYDPNHPQISSYWGGSWFSTNREGECPSGRAPGDGQQPPCSWRQTPGTQPRTVNASCLAERVLAPIEKNYPSCFDSCHQGRGSKCWTQCLETAVEGDSQKGIKPIARAPIIEIWSHAFAPETEGGCKDIGTAPPPSAVTATELPWF